MTDDNIFEQYSELVRRFKSGDESAFTEIYENSQKMVYVTCLGILNNEQDAEDAMQETYMTVYEKLGTLDAENTFVTWLKTIAANKARDKFRAKKNDSSYDDVVATEEFIEGDDNLENLPDTLILEKDKRDTFYKIIRNELSDEQFQTTLLYYYDELPVAQIAQIMDCSENTIKSKLRLARVKIRAGVEAFEKENKITLMGAAAGTGSLANFFNAYYNSVKVPPIKVGAAARGVAGKAGANISVKAGTEAAAETAAKTAASSSLPKILGIVCAAVVGVGIIIGAILFVTSLNKDDNKYSPETEQEETTVSTTETEATDTSVTETTETSETTIATTTVNPDEWKAAYLEVVNSTSYSSFEDEDGNIPDEGEFTFDLVYINEDDTPELLVCLTKYEDLGMYDKEMYEEMGDVSHANLYTYTDGKVIELMHNTVVSVEFIKTARYYSHENKIVNTDYFNYSLDITCFYVTSINEKLDSLETEQYLSSWADLEIYPDGWNPDNDYSKTYYYYYDAETDTMTEISEEEFMDGTSGSIGALKLVASKSLDDIIRELS